MEVVESRDISELENCGSSELENRSKKRAEERCVELELEIVKRKREYEALEAKFRALEVEKLSLEEEIKALKRESDVVKEQVNSGEDEKMKFFGGGKRMERSVDLTEDSLDEDGVFQLMVENKVLECEKKKAESEVVAWKEKFENLESRILKLDKNLVLEGGTLPLAGRIELEDGSPPHVGSFEDSRTTQPHQRSKLADALHVQISLECSRDLSLGKGSCDLQSAGTPANGTPCVHCDGTKEEKTGVCTEANSKRQARKQLKFEEPSPSKKMAPSTPVGAVPSSLGVIDITDSDDEVKITDCHPSLPTDNQGSKKVCISLGSVSGETVGFEEDKTLKKRLKRTHTDRNVEEDADNINEAFLLRSTPKRKCAANVVSDSEKTDVEEDADNSNEAFLLSSTPKRKSAANVVTSDSENTDVEEDADNSNEAFLLGSTPKRKRPTNIVTSDSESSDDNIPIRELKKMHLQETRHAQVGSDVNGSSVTTTAAAIDSDIGTATPSRRRLVRLRRNGERDGAARNDSSHPSKTKYDGKILTNEDAEDAEQEEDGSESEGESLGGFIVNSSDDSESTNEASTKSENSSDDNVDFDEILSKFQRNKDHKSEWEFEADMLSAFGKDPEMCMKAVCALYRQQTAEEKYVKGSLRTNSRGFSKFDALKGSILAEFLSDGDPNGDLRKTAKQLQVYDPSGIEKCRTLASRYSKQLFEIYKNKEDPLFLPSC